jgi:hypothetical protein
MNDALYQLYQGREVTQEECVRVSSDPNEFLRMIGQPPMEEGGGQAKTQTGGMAAQRR